MYDNLSTLGGLVLLKEKAIAYLHLFLGSY